MIMSRRKSIQLSELSLTNLLKLHLELVGHLPIDALRPIVSHAVIINQKHVVSELLLALVAVEVELMLDQTEIHGSVDMV